MQSPMPYFLSCSEVAFVHELHAQARSAGHAIAASPARAPAPRKPLRVRV